MSDGDKSPFGDDEFLTLRVSGGQSLPERLMLVGRPRDGNVRVREWTTETFNSSGQEYDIEAAELLSSLSAAHASGRSLGTDLYRVQLWLNG